MAARRDRPAPHPLGRTRRMPRIAEANSRRREPHAADGLLAPVWRPPTGCWSSTATTWPTTKSRFWGPRPGGWPSSTAPERTTGSPTAIIRSKRCWRRGCGGLGHGWPGIVTRPEPARGDAVRRPAASGRRPGPNPEDGHDPRRQGVGQGRQSRLARARQAGRPGDCGPARPRRGGPARAAVRLGGTGGGLLLPRRRGVSLGEDGNVVAVAEVGPPHRPGRRRVVQVPAEKPADGGV